LIEPSPDPCQRYDWPEESVCRWTLGSGTHACRHEAGHADLCCCAICGSVALRRTELAPPEVTP